jgi:hypothetical protein
MKYLALAAVVLLSACNATVAISNDVAAAEVSLTAAEQAALIYTNRPRCGGTVTLCSDPATVAKIKALDNQAYTAVTMARDNKGTLSAAIAAVSAFSLAIPK